MVYCFVLDVLFEAANVLSCKTSAGEGSGYTFRISLLSNNTVADGTDTYSYPAIPQVLKASSAGCVDQPLTNSTIDCPTKGLVTLTVAGANFAPTGLQVRIGSAACTDVVYVDNSTLTCTLPAGAGLNRPIIVTVGRLFSRPASLISYKAAAITSVTGCVANGVSTEKCPRNDPSRQITLTGTNFGASNAIVFVGGKLCTFPSHDSLTPHEKLTCFLPPNNKLNRVLLLLQSGGQVSAGVGVFVSYLQCAPGSFSLVCSSKA